MILGGQWAQGAIGFARQICKSSLFTTAQPACGGPLYQMKKSDETQPAANHREAVAAALRQGFGVQYWGQDYSAAGLAAAPHGLLIIEATKVGANHSDTGREVFFTREEIQTIRQQGHRPVLAYLNLSEIEDYRDYWVRLNLTGSDPAHPPSQRWIGPRGSSAEHLAQYWTPEWEGILAARVDMLMAMGFDGLFFDDVLHYYSFATDGTVDWTGIEPSDPPEDAAGFARAMMQLVEQLSARSRINNSDGIILVNSGAFIGQDAVHNRMDQAGVEAFATYLDAIDAIMMEDVFTSDMRKPTIEVLKDEFAAAGTAVLAVDFATSFPGQDPQAIRARLSRSAAAYGFTSYLADDTSFDRLYPPIIAPHQTHPASLGF